jgi:hypothetical protein
MWNEWGHRIPMQRSAAEDVSQPTNAEGKINISSGEDAFSVS